MKIFSILFATIFFTTYNYSQKTEIVDSVSTDQLNQQKVIIRGHLTIQEGESPLYIVDGVPMLIGGIDFTNLDPEDIKSIQILKDTSMFSCNSTRSVNDVILISTIENTPKIKSKEYPFKTYKVCNENWNVPQDVYNDIQAKVPNVSITTSADFNAIPKISMRGDDNTIVIVDGIR